MTGKFETSTTGGLKPQAYKGRAVGAYYYVTGGALELFNPENKAESCMLIMHADNEGKLMITKVEPETLEEADL